MKANSSVVGEPAPDANQYSHDEETLQAPAISWLIAEKGYDEILSDVHATGHRFDSIGLIDGRLYLIEVKPTVGNSLVSHALGKGGSIESKISGGLRDLYSSFPPSSWVDVQKCWIDCGRSPPIVVVLSAGFNDGGALARMLALRSAEWRFDYALWLWMGGEVIEIAKGSAPVTRPHEFASLDIPKQSGYGKRAASRSHEAFQAMADELGIGSLFTFVLVEAERYGLRVKRRRRAVALHRARPPGSWVASIPLDKRSFASSLNGLNFSFDKQAFWGGQEGYPGRLAPKGGCFGMNNRFLANEGEITRMFGLLRP